MADGGLQLVGGGGGTTHPLTHQLQKVSVDTSYLSRSGCGGPDNQQARVKKMEVCSAQLVSVRLPQPCAGPTSTLTKHYDSRPSTHGPHSVGCRCGCDTVAVKAMWATSDTHGVATPALCCCVLQLFTYGSVGGGLLSDKYVELEPQKGLFGGYNSVCC